MMSGVMVEDGDDCGWWCVLKGVELRKGVWYGLWWVWLERCRDGRYAVNASLCDMWVICACLPVLVSLVFGEVFFGGSASLHDCFLYFLESARHTACKVLCNSKKTCNHMNEWKNLSFTARLKVGFE